MKGFDTAPPEEEAVKGSISAKTYVKYFLSSGSYLLPVIVLAVFAVAAVSQHVCLYVHAWDIEISMRY